MHNKNFIPCLFAAALMAGGCAHQVREASAVDSATATAAANPPVTQSADDAEPASGLAKAAKGVSSGFASINETITQLYNNATGKTPRRYRDMMESQNADSRRVGINGLVDRPFGKQAPYTTRYQEIATEPGCDYLVRATAIRALNRSRDASAVPIFVRGLRDKNAQVRLESAKALNRLPSDDAVAPLLDLVRKADEDKDVRIAAAEALKHYKKLEVARALVSVLNEREFGIAWEARRSLRNLTGRDHRYDESAWLAYITGPEKPLG